MLGIHSQTESACASPTALRTQEPGFVAAYSLASSDLPILKVHAPTDLSSTAYPFVKFVGIVNEGPQH